MQFSPYADDSMEIKIQGLTIENGTDCLKVFGQIDFDRSQTGLDDLQQLSRLINLAIHALEADPDLPVRLDLKQPELQPNPFI